MIVALDDVHWADDASLELIAHLLHRRPRGRVLLALALRPAPAHPRLDAALVAAQRDGNVADLRLMTLTPQDAQALVGDAIPEQVREAICARGGGNPFFLGELVREHAAGRAPAPARGAVPPGVAAVLGEEIAALPDGARTLALGAAVSGDPFELDVAAAAAQLDAGQVLDALDTLVASTLVVELGAGRRYGFRHPLLREALEDSASAGWRLGAHERAAAALRDRGATAAELAPHLERSARVGDDAAVDVLAEAARQAAPRAPGTAAAWFGAALRLLPASPATARAAARVPDGPCAGAGRDRRPAGGARRPWARRSRSSGPIRCSSAPGSSPRARWPSSCSAATRRRTPGCARRWPSSATRPTRSPPPTSRSSWRPTRCTAATSTRRSTGRARRGTAAREHAEPALEAKAGALVCWGHLGLGDGAAAQQARGAAAEAIDTLPDELLAMRLDAAHYLGFAEFFCEHYDDAIRHLKRGSGRVARVGAGPVRDPDDDRSRALARGPRAAR